MRLRGKRLNRRRRSVDGRLENLSSLRIGWLLPEDDGRKTGGREEREVQVHREIVRGA